MTLTPTDPPAALLPCPFCGCGDMLKIVNSKNDPSPKSWIYCMACDASSKPCVPQEWRTAQEAAISFWNMRRPSEALAAEITRLREALTNARTTLINIGNKYQQPWEEVDPALKSINWILEKL